MQETSLRFRRAVRTSGQRKTVIRVRDAFGTAILFDNVPISSGQINVDRNSDVRRSGQVTIGNKDLVDLFTSTDTDPFGMELEILNGVVYPNGEEELVRLGLFTVEGFSWDEGGDASLPTLEISDRSQFVHRAKLSASRDFSGFRAKDVITTVLTDVIPSANIDIDDSLPNPRLPGGSTFDDDRWEVIKSCAEAMAAEAYFDRDGTFRVTEIKDPVATVDATSWEFNTGEGFSQVSGSNEGYINEKEQGVLVSANRSIDRKQTYNAVIVYGAAPNGATSQPFAIASDNDVNSPTYYNGPFGKSIYRIDNPILVTSSQCAEVAVAELNSRLGYSRGISFSALSNPALDEGDYCLFTFLDGSQEVHLLDSFSIPLVSGDFTGETRTSPSRQTASIKIKKSTVLLDRKPSPPAALRVTATTNNSITLAWSMGSPGGNPLQFFEVFRGEESVRRIDSSLQNTTITGLASGTTYSFHVVAIDAAGVTSDKSKSLSARTSGPTGPPIKPEKFTEEYRAVWSGSYNGAKAKVAKYNDLCYQGFKDDGLGDMRSLIGFDWKKIQEDTNGAYIIGCYITLYFKEWGTKKGGTAVIGFHNYTTGGMPTTWSDKKVFQDRVRSSGWPAKGRRPINLGRGVGESFKNGVFTGIALGPTPNNFKKYRGICEGANGGSVEPVLTIVYSRETA